MKKLFMLVVVAVLAFASQAAQLDWQYNAAKADVGKTVYVLLGTTPQTSWDSVAAVEEASISHASVAKKGVKYNASATAVSDSLTKAGASVYYVIVSSDATSFDVTSAYDMKGSVYDPAAQESSAGADTSLSSASIASSGNSFGGGGGQGGGDGPEPTSGILLLVGAGILGLRRKRA